MTAYIIFIRETPIHAPAEMQAYQQAPRAKLGAIEPLAVYGALTPLEGESPDGVVILKFPTVDDAKAWYYSPEYQAAALHRRNAAAYRAVIVEGFEPPRP